MEAPGLHVGKFRGQTVSRVLPLENRPQVVLVGRTGAKPRPGVQYTASSSCERLELRQGDRPSRDEHCVETRHLAGEAPMKAKSEVKCYEATGRRAPDCLCFRIILWFFP